MRPNDFTACPNGRPERGNPHRFIGYHPDEGQPLLFCQRCGEVRALAAPIEEPRMVTAKRKGRKA